ncbi:MAG: DUF411 domain-containing protein [Gemmatimonadetes bacterium]|nr:DUF411 domain-containing protein [Gemmatimonadota bacterium]
MWTLGALTLAGAGAVLLASAEAPRDATPAAVTEALAMEPGVVKVWKSPTCGCCGGWVDHMREAGFEVEVVDTQDLRPIKAEHGVTDDLASCHTAVVDGYVVEGHVPAADIRRLLAERPDIAGIAAPGMPTGSPGMEVPGRPADAYDVVAFTRDGGRTVFASH